MIVPLISEVSVGVVEAPRAVADGAVDEACAVYTDDWRHPAWAELLGFGRYLARSGN
jgi:hypothetical protein